MEKGKRKKFESFPLQKNAHIPLIDLLVMHKKNPEISSQKNSKRSFFFSPKKFLNGFSG